MMVYENFAKIKFGGNFEIFVHLMMFKCEVLINCVKLNTFFSRLLNKKQKTLIFTSMSRVYVENDNTLLKFITFIHIVICKMNKLNGNLIVHENADQTMLLNGQSAFAT